jgi:hypothetical protein
MKRSETTETQSNPWDDPAGLSPLTCTFLSPQTNMAVGTVAAPEHLMGLALDGRHNPGPFSGPHC